MSDKCTSSSVENRRDLRTAEAPEIQHAGVISHKCALERNHEPPCVCECGLYAWKRHHES